MNQNHVAYRDRVCFGPALLLGLISLSGVVAKAETVDPIFASPPTRSPQLVVDAEGFSGSINRMAISDDGHWLAAVAGKVVRVWDLENNRLHATLRGYQEPGGFSIGYIDALSFAPDNQQLLVGVSDNSPRGSTRVYDLRAPERIQQLIVGHKGCTRGITFSNSGERLATWGCDGDIIVYRREARRYQILFKAPWGRSFSNADLSVPDTTFQFTPDDQYVLLRTNTPNGTPTVVSIAQRRSLTASFEIPVSIRAWHDRHNDMRGPFGKWSSSYREKWVALDNSLADHEPHFALFGRGEDPSYFASTHKSDGRHIAHRKHNYSVTTLAWNRKAGLVASADELGEIHVWDPMTGELRNPIIRPVNAKIWNVRWSKDGKSLLYATDFYRGDLWQRNQYGGIDSRIDLSSMLITKVGKEVAARYPDAPISPRAEHPTLGTLELTLGKNQWGGLDFYAERVGGEGGRYNLNPWSDDGRARARIKNFRIRVPQRHFGTVQCMRFIDYPGARTGPRLVFGTTEGRLFEALIENMDGEAVALRLIKEFLGHTDQINSIDVSPDATKLVSCSLDGTLRIYPLMEARDRGDVDLAHDGTTVTAVPAGSYARMAGIREGDVLLRFGEGSFYERIRQIQEGRYRVGETVPITLSRGANWNAQARLTLPTRLTIAPDMLLPLASVFLTRDGEHVAWTPEGYYDASSKGGKHVGWHVNQARDEPAKFYPIEQFQPRYYQPKMVRYAIAESSPELAVVRLRTESSVFEEAVAPPKQPVSVLVSNLPPTIDILSPAPNAINNDGRVSIVTRVRSAPESQLSRVRYRVDGRPVKGLPKRTSQRKTPEGLETWFEQQVALAAGQHEVTVSAECSNETRGSKSVTCRVAGRDEVLRKARLHILSVGLSHYANGDLHLPFGSVDAKGFVEAWRNLSDSAFEEVNAKILTDQQATAQGIRTEGFGWLLRQDIQPNDTVMVFLAGHGLYDDFDEWFFAGHDLELSNLIATGISDAALDSFLSKIPANTILFTDTCHAGGFSTDTPVRLHPQSGGNLWLGRGHVVFASCLPEEQSYESSEWGHGAFTRSIVDFLASSTSDYNGDGQLAFDEMSVFVRTGVRSLTGNAQNPVVEMPSSVSNIVFTKVKQKTQRSD
ncbi:MAG: hypothetical protein AAGD07_17400 [Planctomycetota bacterium]